MRYLVLALVLLWGNVVAAQRIPAQVEYPTTEANPEQQFGLMRAAPIKQIPPGRLSKTLADIESHMPDGHIYRDSDVGTWAHETTHGINSRLRQAVGSGIECYYCLDDKVWVLRRPRTTLSRVAAAVPANLRGSQFSLYFVQQLASWNDHPLYVMDEWTAYIHGAMTLHEYYGNSTSGPDGRSIPHDTNSAVQFIAYASAMLRVVEHDDPSYPDMQKLKDCVSYNIDRTMALTKVHPQDNHLALIKQTYFQGPCYGNDCSPQWSGGYWSYPQRQPAQTQPTLQPVPPKPQPTAPKPAISQKGCTCEDLSEYKDLVASLKAEITDLKGLIEKGVLKGDKGDKGDSPVIDLNELAVKTADKVREGLTLPVRTMNNGQLSPVVEYPLDNRTPVTLMLRPRSKKGGDQSSTQQVPNGVPKK